MTAYVAYGCTWPHMVAYGHIWLHLTVFYCNMAAHERIQLHVLVLHMVPVLGAQRDLVILGSVLYDFVRRLRGTVTIGK